MKYFINFRKVKLKSGEIRYDVWLNSRTCNGEYIGMFESLQEAYRAIKTMLEQGILF